MENETIWGVSYHSSGRKSKQANQSTYSRCWENVGHRYLGNICISWTPDLARTLTHSPVSHLFSVCASHLCISLHLCWDNGLLLNSWEYLTHSVGGPCTHSVSSCGTWTVGTHPCTQIQRPTARSTLVRGQIYIKYKSHVTSALEENQGGLKNQGVQQELNMRDLSHKDWDRPMDRSLTVYA